MYNLKAGDTLDNRFKLTSLIKEGGMGYIFEAIDATTGQTVAIKVPFLKFESDPAFFSRFEREEEVGRLLNHPSILRILPVEKKSRPYIVMERLEGDLLSDRLDKAKRLPVPEALDLLLRVIDAMEYMHGKKIIHRDLKPQNIMLCKDGSIRIMDFGLAKGEGLRRVTFAGFSPEMGTPDYMSPEQVKGKGGDERSDIYSLGAMLFEMTTGQTPFDGKDPFTVMNARLVGDPPSPRKLNPEISPQLEEILLHAMARDPAERHPSLRELKAELAAPEKVTVTGRVERLVVPDLGKVRWRKARFVIGAIIVIIVAIIIMTAKAGKGRH
jgi:serine/threonine-protein kinase